MKHSIALLALTLAACATSTGVVPMGTGGYMVSKLDHSAWSGGEVKAGLLREASLFCAKQGKVFAPVTSRSEDAVLYQRAASAEVQFRCE
jgi:hypothetical protein